MPGGSMTWCQWEFWQLWYDPRKSIITHYSLPLSQAKRPHQNLVSWHKESSLHFIDLTRDLTRHRHSYRMSDMHPASSSNMQSEEPITLQTCLRNLHTTQKRIWPYPTPPSTCSEGVWTLQTHPSPTFSEGAWRPRDREHMRLWM